MTQALDIWRRRQQAAALRKSGATFKEIGVALGVTKTRAHQIFQKSQGIRFGGREAVGVVYAIRSGDLIKIGFTKDWNGRRKWFERELPEFQLLFLLPKATRRIERAFHNKFAKQRVKAEWFKINREILAWTERAKTALS